MPLWISILFTASGYVIALALIPRIVLQRRESGATLAWVLAIAFLPWLGLVLFWVFGTQRIRWRRRKRQLAEALVAAGGKVSRFLPVNLISRRLMINNRNHRKIVVADGRVAFIGGINVGREYFGRSPELGKWRDTHLRVEGPAVHRLQEIFVEDWYHAAREAIARPRYLPDPVPCGAARVHSLAT